MKVFESWRTWADAEPDLRRRLPPPVVDSLAAAYEFAAGWHGDQTRPAGEPYVEHLLQALEIALDVGATTSVEVLTAVLLHDVVEDTGCTIEEVRERFGAEVAGLVAAVTKPEPAAGDDPDAIRRGYVASFAGAPQDVLLVKLSDRYSNVQRLDRHPRLAKQVSYYAETVRWFVPLADLVPPYAPLFAEWRTQLGHLAAG